VSYNKLYLSGQEAALLSGWERERRLRVTSDELQRLLGSSTGRIVAGLIRKGLLERIAPGVYVIHPFRSLGHPRTFSSAVLLSALLADEPHYLGGWWAFSLHRLSQQLYSSVIDAYVTRERRPRRLGSARAIFHVVPPTALAYGIESIMIEATSVRVSDAERTVLDALNYPTAFGGIREALRLVEPALGKIDRRRLVAYAARESRSSTCQRLGVLLERLGSKPPALAPLARCAGKTTSLISMVPGAPRTGPVNDTWWVVENDRDRTGHDLEGRDDRSARDGGEAPEGAEQALGHAPPT